MGGVVEPVAEPRHIKVIVGTMWVTIMPVWLVEA